MILEHGFQPQALPSTSHAGISEQIVRSLYSRHGLYLHTAPALVLKLADAKMQNAVGQVDRSNDEQSGAVVCA